MIVVEGYTLDCLRPSTKTMIAVAELDTGDSELEKMKKLQALWPKLFGNTCTNGNRRPRKVALDDVPCGGAAQWSGRAPLLSLLTHHSLTCTITARLSVKEFPAEHLEPNPPYTSVFEVALELHKLPDEVMDSDGELGNQFRSWLAGRRRGENIRSRRK